MVRRGMLVLSVGVGALVVGCAGGPEARRPARSTAILESRTTTTSAALTVSHSLSTRSTSVTPAPTPRHVETATAVMRVVTARCDREAACGHVGTGRSYGDRDECANGVGHDVVAAFPSDDCPSGIDAERLDACAAAIDAATCDASTSDGNLPAACALDQLCPGG